MRGQPSVAATYCATLVDEWVGRGLRHAVVSPGSRSTPMALALEAEARVSVDVHPDERSASFMALGIGRATGAPAVVLTTSGTAAVELHPAVVEAHHGFVPMLAVTADRPRELVGTGAPQTIDQRELFGPAVRWYCEPGVPAAEGSTHWRHLACDAYDRTLGAPPGPVHLNLAFDEPLVGSPGELPPAVDLPRPVDLRMGITDERLAALAPLAALTRGVIVAGARAALDDAERDAILDAAERLGWPVLADHLSGLRVTQGPVVGHFDQLLRDPGCASRLSPEVVIRLGGLVSSRVTAEWVDRSRAVVLAIDRWGQCPDPSGRLSDVFDAVPSVALTQMSALAAPDAARRSPEWSDLWRAADRAAITAFETDGRGEPAVVAETVRHTPAGAEMVVSSSMPVRDLEWFAPPRDEVRFHANRGANGIDGVVSTAVGVARCGAPTVVVVGDVAFLHDTNAMAGLSGRGVDLAVVVIDNDGGSIFSFLPQAEVLPVDTFERLFGTPHGVDLVGLATAHGLAAVSVTDASEVGDLLDSWSGEGGVTVIVVGSDRADNAEMHEALRLGVARELARTPGFS